MKIDATEALALKAALLAPEQARLAWQELLGHVAWMDFPDPVVRCLPSIAVNLGSHSRGATDSSGDFPHSARLAGVYRSTWTVNIMRVRALKSTLQAFDERSIRFRVLKGAAVCALTNRWGVRRMGDIDVAVHINDSQECLRILRGIGFTPRFFRVTDDSAPPAAMCWFGPQGQILDVHIVNPAKRGSNVLNLLMGGSSVTVSSQGVQWPLPRAEEMVVHSALHARTGAAESDWAQSLLDLSKLLPLTDPIALSAAAQRARASDSLLNLQSELARLTESPLPQTPSRIRTTTTEVVRMADRIRTEARRLPQVFTERTLNSSCGDLTFVFDSNIRKWLYRAWLTNGQLRPLERAVSVLFGGFLKSGELHIPRDRRLRVHIPNELQGQTVAVHIECPEPYARLLFVDGVSHGVVDKEASLRLLHAPSSIEISMRLLGDPPESPLAPITIKITSFRGLDGDI